jgi:prephenate dehydratase
VVLASHTQAYGQVHSQLNKVTTNTSKISEKTADAIDWIKVI